jgi:hypothetical protein
VHFNCYVPTSGGRGTEVLYVNHDIEYVAAKVSAAIAEAGGLINRGSHHRADLYWLNKTLAPAILIECLFVDAQADVDAYEENFNAICRAIADCAPAAAPTRIEAALPVLRVKGKCSWFGGPEDINGVGPDEGLAFIHEVSQKPELFLPEQPPGTTGLARRLDGQNVDYIALRWDYDVYSKDYLRSNVWARVRAPSTGKEFLAIPADWGPHADTGRQADLSPGLMERLELMTDEVVEVEFPISRPE